MRRYRAIGEFEATEITGPFTRTVTTGDELCFMHWTGDGHDLWAVFAFLIDRTAGVVPGSQFIAKSVDFESLTEPV